jgi:hypothetical protein
MKTNEVYSEAIALVYDLLDTPEEYMDEIGDSVEDIVDTVIFNGNSLDEEQRMFLLENVDEPDTLDIILDGLADLREMYLTEIDDDSEDMESWEDDDDF